METERFTTSYALITDSSLYNNAVSLCLKADIDAPAVPYRDTAVFTQQMPLFAQIFIVCGLLTKTAVFSTAVRVSGYKSSHLPPLTFFSFHPSSFFFLLVFLILQFDFFNPLGVVTASMALVTP